MNITTHRIKQYNSTYKTVVCVDDKPVCIVSGVGKTLSNVIAYLNGYDVPIADCKIKIALDVAKAKSEESSANKIRERMELGACNTISKESLCFSCKTKGCMFQSGIVRSHCDFYKSGSE